MMKCRKIPRKNKKKLLILKYYSPSKRFEKNKFSDPLFCGDETLNENKVQKKNY